MCRHTFNPEPKAISRIVGVALLVALVLGLEALSSSPTLHLRVCPNANRPDHHCAVTDFTTGLAQVAATAVVCAAVLLVRFASRSPAEVFLSAPAVCRLAPSRAPPVGAF